MKLITLPVGSLGVDTNTVLEDEDVDAIADAGYEFIIRYISLGEELPHDLQVPERDRILRRCALGIVQHVPWPGWEPTFALGMKHGEAAVKNVEKLEILKGAILWCDDEGTEGGQPADYLSERAFIVAKANFTPGLYVGDAPGLDAKGLGGLRGIHRYWRSLSRVPEPYPRGWQLMQLSTPGGKPVRVGRVDCDVNVVQGDFFGSLPTWIARDDWAPDS